MEPQTSASADEPISVAIADSRSIQAACRLEGFAVTRISRAIARPLSLAIAFAAGAAAFPLASQLLSPAQAQTAAASSASGVAPVAATAPPLAPMVIDIAGIQESELPATAVPDLRAKGLVATPNATIAIQVGNVGKHYHAGADEIQYIVEGSGTAWLGDTRREIRPGMLIVIPRGTHHAGTEATSGRFKAIAIKIPPQDPKDTIFVN